MMLTPIPQDISFKPAFEERYQALLGEHYNQFIAYSSSYIRKCVRVNTLKITVQALRRRLESEWLLTAVPWCPEGLWIEGRGKKRFDIGNLPEHQLGYIYVQEAASMIPPVVLAPKPGEKVLDLCAAPGSKTTQLGQIMGNEGVLVANDIQGARLKPLGVNLQRCAISNCVATLNANRRLPDAWFDKVLVDAPCTGTGTVRRSLKTMQMWSPGLVQRMHFEQRRLLQLGFTLLKPGGVLVYSTCTLEPEEDEGTVSWLLERHAEARVEPFELKIRRSPAIMEWGKKRYHEDVRHCLRIWPQDNDTEGFFVAKIRKH